VRGVGFEPTNPCRIGASGQNSASIGKNGTIDFDLFKKWLFQNYRPFTVVSMYSYAKRFAYCLLTRDLSDLRTLGNSTREHVMKALSGLSKFLGIHEDFQQLVKNYGLKWSGRNNDDIIIARLLKTVNADEIFQWLKDARAKIPELSELLELMVLTGLRLIEAVESYNIIIKLDKEGKLRGYFNEEKEVLEHFRFKETFIRSSKKVFVSFVPLSLVRRIAKKEPLSYDEVQHVTEWRVRKLRFCDLRELNASIMTKHLRQPEIDFLQGRVSTNVFMINYFNVNLISDLKERAFKAIDEILAEIS
jgi:intergrase/recombinase